MAEDRTPQDAAPEELHAYDAPVALSPEFEWVALEPHESSRYRQLRLLRGDLDFTFEVLTHLLEHWEAGGFVTPQRSEERDDLRARWNAAVVAYTRAFMSGTGERLKPTIFDGDSAELHSYFMRLRKRHVAHSVADYEDVHVLLALSRDTDAKVEGLLDSFTVGQIPGRRRVEQLLALAKQAHSILNARLKEERELLLTHARLNLHEVSQRSRVTEIASPRFDDQVRVRKE